MPILNSVTNSAKTRKAELRNGKIYLTRRSGRKDRIEWVRIFTPIAIPKGHERSADIILHDWALRGRTESIPTSWLVQSNSPRSEDRGCGLPVRDDDSIRITPLTGAAAASMAPLHLSFLGGAYGNA